MSPVSIASTMNIFYIKPGQEKKIFKDKIISIDIWIMPIYVSYLNDI